MFHYFGSKRRLAPTYQPPKHDLIVEPFAGAAGYAVYWLERRSDLRAVLVDADPLVVRLWTRLLKMEPQELFDYPAPVQGEQTADPVHLIGSVSSGTWAKLSRWAPSVTVTEWMARDFRQVAQRAASQLAVIGDRIEIIEGDYTDAPDVEATWFVDPPYQKQGRHYATGNNLDFRALGEWCRSRRGQVIACEALGADWLPFQPHKTNQTIHANTTGRQVEVVWYSDPEPTLFSFADEEPLLESVSASDP